MLQLASNNLLYADLLEFVETKFCQSTCRMSVDNLQETSHQQAVASHANASLYRLVGNKFLGVNIDKDEIREHQAEMDSSYKELLDLAQVRRARLEESLALQKFYRDVDEEEIWISEKDTFLSSTDYGRDLNTIVFLLKKHEVQ